MKNILEFLVNKSITEFLVNKPITEFLVNKPITEFLVNKPITGDTECKFDLYQSKTGHVYIKLKTKKDVDIFSKTELGSNWCKRKNDAIGSDVIETLKEEISKNMPVLFKPALYNEEESASVSFRIYNKVFLNKSISSKDFTIEYWEKNNWKI